jgi:hypothetical protein
MAPLTLKILCWLFWRHWCIISMIFFKYYFSVLKPLSMMFHALLNDDLNWSLQAALITHIHFSSSYNTIGLLRNISWIFSRLLIKEFAFNSMQSLNMTPFWKNGVYYYFFFDICSKVTCNFFINLNFKWFQIYI